jgi:hypothetical protein
MRTARPVGNGAAKSASRKWQTLSAMGFAAALAFAAWRITTNGDAAIDRIDEQVAPRLAAGKASLAQYRPLSDWKLGKRSWGSDADGDESDLGFVAPDDPDRHPEYQGLDVAEEGR